MHKHNTSQKDTVRASTATQAAEHGGPSAREALCLPAAPGSLRTARDRFLLVSRLGEGGMGTVYEALDQHLLRRTAVKQLHSQLAGSPETCGRFRREAKLTGWLDHPNIVPVYEAWEGNANEPDSISMKLVEGQTFERVIAASKDRPLSPEQLEQQLRVLRAVCDALSFAHARGVVHRDVKSANVMVANHGQVYLMDWGIAKVLDGRSGPPRSQRATAENRPSGLGSEVAMAGPAGSAPQQTPAEPRDRTESGPLRPPVGSPLTLGDESWARTSAVCRATSGVDDSVEESAEGPSWELEGTAGGSLIGSPCYMAPEQAWGNAREVDQRTDVFGVGALLYEILTGTPPYDPAQGRDVLERARAARIDPPQGRSPHRALPPELCRIALKALSANPEDRYQSITELTLDLDAAQRGGEWFELRSYPPGHVVVQEGEPSSEAFIIRAGRCAVTKLGADGETRVIRQLGPGEVFGEMGLITREPRSASVRCLEPVTVAVITRGGLERELNGRGMIGLLLDAIARRFLDVDAKLDALRRTSSASATEEIADPGSAGPRNAGPGSADLERAGSGGLARDPVLHYDEALVSSSSTIAETTRSS